MTLRSLRQMRGSVKAEAFSRQEVVHIDYATDEPAAVMAGVGAPCKGGMTSGNPVNLHGDHETPLEKFNVAS